MCFISAQGIDIICEAERVLVICFNLCYAGALALQVQEAASLADASMEAKIGASLEARVEHLSQVVSC